ncbi:hypothetical protein NM688_g626 [Phlebia brevispora]|uniref:Uncharacterized protein n=1 Tax=Phlebia brevispora TaxID=194682 RepID=A0ACC1TDU1_9APHY|nr:hypothetical protein NM688_g626 [Phlebia brevispora]
MVRGEWLLTERTRERSNTDVSGFIDSSLVTGGCLCVDLSGENDPEQAAVSFKKLLQFNGLVGVVESTPGNKWLAVSVLIRTAEMSPNFTFEMISFTRSWPTLFLLFVLPSLLSAAPVAPPRQRRSITLPIHRQKVGRDGPQRRDDGLVGTVGVGDLADLFYTVSVQLGNTTTAVNLDTGSSDLWVMTDACHTRACLHSSAQPYPATSGQPTGASVLLQYGDSTSGTNASGPVVLDTVTVAGLTMQSQAFAAVNETNNSAVQNGGAGIFGLGFPTQSFVQASVVDFEFNTPSTTDEFVSNINTFGPLISRLAMSGDLDQPMFSITLQRDTIDVSGKGQITVGDLPQGVDNSSITWVPVRLYDSGDGGLNAPSFAPNEIYPLRWEVPLDAVFLDGQQLAPTTLTGASPELSALVDTGNSILRGPQDVVNNILSSVSPAFAADQTALPTFPCATPHTLAFQIGGNMFPVDPRDFVAPNATGDATTWSLGDPFFKSNTVVFYYGNLTNPSVDPPRIGFLSMVPQNASTLLQNAVQEAQADGGIFETSSNTAPTASTVITVEESATPLFNMVSQSPPTTLSTSPPQLDSQTTASSSAPSPSSTATVHSGTRRILSSSSLACTLLSMFALVFLHLL